MMIMRSSRGRRVRARNAELAAAAKKLACAKKMRICVHVNPHRSDTECIIPAIPYSRIPVCDVYVIPAPVQASQASQASQAYTGSYTITFYLSLIMGVGVTLFALV